MADASALVDYLLRTPRGLALAPHLEAAMTDLHVPALCDLEVAAALRRAILREELTEARAYQALVDYLDLPLSRHGHQDFLRRILELRRNFSAYDAAYVVLAELLEVPIITGDGGLAAAIGQHLGLEVINA